MLQDAALTSYRDLECRYMHSAITACGYMLIGTCIPLALASACTYSLLVPKFAPSNHPPCTVQHKHPSSSSAPSQHQNILQASSRPPKPPRGLWYFPARFLFFTYRRRLWSSRPLSALYSSFPRPFPPSTKSICRPAPRTYCIALSTSPFLSPLSRARLSRFLPPLFDPQPTL